MGAVDAETARRALSIAMDEGVTHFDVARSYGFGQAEQFLGEFIHHRRQQVVIASKFGITATMAAIPLRLFKPLVRPFTQKKRGAKPSSEAVAKPARASSRFSPANLFLKRVRLVPLAMERSLEKSLQELRTDYLDYFFLHEPLETVPQIEDILAAADGLKKAGKIRAFGLAYLQEQAGLHREYLSHFDLLQMNNSPGFPNYSQLMKERGQLPNIFFSPFQKTKATSTVEVGQPKDILHQLSSDFPASVILASMFNENHIRENIRAIQ